MRDDGSHDFHVDGHHKTIFQVELPPWLPLDIVQKLTRKFEGYLWSQIGALMESHRQCTIIPSGQSAHNYNSDSSDGEEDFNNGAYYRGTVDFDESIKQMVAEYQLQRQLHLRTINTHSSSVRIIVC